MNGMEILVQNILKASGVDPEKVKADIVEYGQKLSARIASMDESMKDLKTAQGEMLLMIEGLRQGQVTVSELLLEISRAIGHQQRTNGASAVPAIRGDI